MWQEKSLTFQQWNMRRMRTNRSVLRASNWKKIPHSANELKKLKLPELVKLLAELTGNQLSLPKKPRKPDIIFQNRSGRGQNNFNTAILTKAKLHCEQNYIVHYDDILPKPGHFYITKKLLITDSAYRF